MRELVIISGKGGTGKTSILASFAVLAENCVVADADVDAADLHLLLRPTIMERQEFSGGSRARILPEQCNGCGKCAEVCRFNAILSNGRDDGKPSTSPQVDPIACEGCGVCAYFCPEDAIEFAPALNGELFVSDTRCGPLVHAKLGIAEENSGKLVALVRARARAIAEQQQRSLILVDGSPGVGCPVISSLTGADQALIVTEPTLSGLHDLERVADLTRHFGIDTQVCINKWDLNQDVSAAIEARARRRGLPVAGKIRYDRAVTRAQLEAQTTVERTCDAGNDIRELWRSLEPTGD